MYSLIKRDIQDKYKLEDTVIFALGIGVIRAWYVYTLYDLYTSITYGFAPIMINVVRIATIVVLVLTSLIVGKFPKKTEVTLTWISLFLMTSSSLLHAYEIYFGITTFWVLRCVLAGIGLAWGGGVWVKIYEKLGPISVFASVTGGLTLSCFLILLMGIVATKVAVVLSLFLPTFASVMYIYANSTLSVQRNPKLNNRLNRGSLVYALKINYKFLMALCIFALILGLSRGVPQETIAVPHFLEWVLSQLMVIGLALISLWLVIHGKKSFSISIYWLVENAFVVLSICLLMSTWDITPRLTSVFIGVATACFYTFVFYYAYTVGRRYAGPMYTVVGTIYALVLACMNFGRILSTSVLQNFPAEGYVLILAVLVMMELILVLMPDSLTDWPLHSSEQTIDDSAQNYIEDIPLTDLESKIIFLLSQGRSRAVIASSLGYSQNTIRNYIYKIYQKVHVHSKQELLDKMYNQKDETSH